MTERENEGAAVTAGVAPEVAELQGQAEAAGTNLSELCRRAGVARSTPQRWLSGDGGPTLETLNKLREALREFAADRKRAMADAGL